MQPITRILVLTTTLCLVGLVARGVGRKAWKKLSGTERLALVRERKGDAVRQMCENAGITYPPGEIQLRAFKESAELELWGAGKIGDPMSLLKTFQIVAQSGQPGPKRREGDLQVPEGVYQIVIFNPKSSYHLSLGLNYPNAADRVHADPDQPGSDIFIHGSSVSIGCLAMGDDAIEELYLIASDMRAAGHGDFPVHLFPARMAGPAWETMRARHPQWQPFWSELQPIHDAFIKNRRPPKVAISPDGHYQMTSGR